MKPAGTATTVAAALLAALPLWLAAADVRQGLACGLAVAIALAPALVLAALRRPVPYPAAALWSLFGVAAASWSLVASGLASPGLASLFVFAVANAGWWQALRDGVGLVALLRLAVLLALAPPLLALLRSTAALLPGDGFAVLLAQALASPAALLLAGAAALALWRHCRGASVSPSEEPPP